MMPEEKTRKTKGGNRRTGFDLQQPDDGTVHLDVCHSIITIGEKNYVQSFFRDTRE
jgi:hypothetical protein